jgi:hypothetical protein
MCNVKNHIPRPFDASVVLPCECVGVEQLEFRNFFLRSVSFYCQVSDTGSVGWASSFSFPKDGQLRKPGSITVDDGISIQHQVTDCARPTSPVTAFKWILGSAHWACIAHLTIEWYWSKFQREIIITLKNSSHLEWRVGLSDTILKGTHPRSIETKRELQEITYVISCF